MRRDFPDRFLLGIGVGHPEATSDYTRPLTAMRKFVDGLDLPPDELVDHVRLQPLGHGPESLDDYRALARVLI